MCTVLETVLRSVSTTFFLFCLPYLVSKRVTSQVWTPPNPPLFYHRVSGLSRTFTQNKLNAQLKNLWSKQRSFTFGVFRFKRRRKVLTFVDGYDSGVRSSCVRGGEA